MLAGAELSQQLITVNEETGNINEAGKWFYNKKRTIRAMALDSKHPYHFGKTIMFYNPVEKDKKNVPKKMGKWKCGKTIAFLIDFLNEDGKPELRVFSQTSPAEKPYGFFPEEILAEKSVDVAIMSVADVPTEGFPYEFLKYAKPKMLLLAHWENFFRSREKKLKQILKGDLEPVVENLGVWCDSVGIQMIMPAPGSSVILK